MTDHVQMLRLIAMDLHTDPRSSANKIRARAIGEAADYLQFLEESVTEEISAMREEFTSQTALLEAALEYLKSGNSDL